MSDRYISLANGPLKAVVKSLGLPAPARLRRFDAADPKGGFLTDPILVVGATPGGDELSTLLLANGFEVVRAVTPGHRYAALIGAYDGLDDPAQLGEVTLGIGKGIKQLSPGGRIITISRAATIFPHTTGSLTPAANAARNAVTGITRSLAHEMRGGATANGIVLDGVPMSAPSAVAALWFLLSAKSAYVSGQFLTVSSDRGTPVGSEEFAATGADPRAPLTGRLAVVTGAARGIGAAIARTLHRDGAQVFGVDVPAAGEALARTMNEIGGVAIQLDITAPDAGAAIAAQVGRPIDILIHNAGITRDRLLANMDRQQWDSVLDVNISAQLRINAALSELEAWGDHPHVVSLASTSGIAGNRGQANYAASKAAVIGMAAAGAEEFAARGGTINAIAPGFIETEMTARMPTVTRELARRISSLQQGGLPQDVAEAVSFLAGESAGGINGKVLRVCGQNMVGA
ncbi:3-oxoacyl-ACP reductase [Brevibacterium daeguense]|uniref:3-oxoacyl-ACP reductase n=1 Tax=Brevibacterium daeguense TaxID=909936 RepID=A0ABP8ENE1_9MICO|nr:3-oxoacyl-ACP reductase [Brevibacterium daeguense]